MPKFYHDELLEFGAALLSASGVPPQDARLVARLLVNSDLHGYAAHGTAHIPSYLERMKMGLIRLDNRAEVVREGKTTALINANFYIGQVVAYEGMRIAIRKAREHGTGIVCIHHSGHVGRLADYVELAAKESAIGIAAVSVGGGPIAPFGGMEPFAGTNPMAFGIPAKDRKCLIFDFATAALSMGELRTKAARGDAIPPGAMLDGHGHPTTDFNRFLGPPRGVVLPFGEYKGAGLHLMVEILGGVLSGNGLGKEWREKGGPAINGVFLQAIDIEEFQPAESFFHKLDELVRWAKSITPAPGNPEILLPGERSGRKAERQLREGIEIEEKAWGELLQRAKELGVKEIPKPL